MADRLQPPTRHIDGMMATSGHLGEALGAAPYISRRTGTETRGEKDPRLEALRQERHLGAVIEESYHHAFDLYFNTKDSKILANRQRIEVGIDEDTVQRAVLLGDMQGISHEDPRYPQLLEAASYAHHLARTTIKDIVGGDNNLSLSPTQRLTILATCDIADQIDILNELWVDEVINGAVSKEFNQLGHDEALKHAKVAQDEASGDYLYGVFRRDVGGEIAFVPYARAYPEQIKAIGHIIDTLTTQLDSLPDEEARRMSTVYQGIRNLLTYDGTPAEQNILAEQLDRTWMEKLPANEYPIQPIYPFEAYADIFSSLVEFDFSLAIKDDRFEAINQDAQTVKEAMVQYFGQDPEFQQFDVTQESLPILENSNAAIYTMIIAGSRLGFRSAAQNLVNRGNIRLEYGSKIFEDRFTFEQRYEIAKNAVSKMFGEDYFNEHLGDKEAYIRMLAGTFVAGHEVGHNLFVVADSQTKLGRDMYASLEECKSDLAAAVVAPTFLSREQQAFMVKTLFAEEVRGMTRRAQVNDPSHFYGNIVNIQMMLDAGLVVNEHGSWKFDISNDKLDTFFGHAKMMLLEFADIYQSRDPQKGEAFRQKYFKETPEVLDVELATGILTAEEHARLVDEVTFREIEAA